MLYYRWGYIPYQSRVVVRVKVIVRVEVIPYTLGSPKSKLNEYLYFRWGCFPYRSSVVVRVMEIVRDMEIVRVNVIP